MSAKTASPAPERADLAPATGSEPILPSPAVPSPAVSSPAAAPSALAPSALAPSAVVAGLASGEGPTVDPDSRGGGFAPVAAGVRTWLRHWDAASVPAFVAVRDVAPSASLANALKAPAARPDGAVRTSASLYDPPTGGVTLEWARNWVAETQLPPAPDDGRLYYRFRVGARLVLDGAAELSSVTTSLHLGVTRDTAVASPFDDPALTTAAARPFAAVRADDDVELDGTELIEGSLDVRAGCTPALALVLGIEVRLRDGWARLHEGTSLWIGPADPGPTGILEYRYAPASLLRLFDPASAAHPASA